MTEETRSKSTGVIPEELGGFVDALRHVKLKSAIGFAVGWLLIWIERKWFKDYPVVGPLLDHMGMAFIVCAIAIFGYEWHSHQGQIVGLAQRLARLADDLRKMQEMVIHFNKETFKQNLPHLFSNKTDNALAGPIGDLIDNADALSKAPAWTQKFVAQLLGDIVLENAKQLSHLGQAPGDYRGGITVAEARAADQMLKAQMLELQAGDQYDVISDLKSWKEKQLEHFREASKQAAKDRGVRVQRIFNLIKEDVSNPTVAEEAVTIFEEHLRDSSECKGNYNIKVLFKEDMNRPELKKRLMSAQMDDLQFDHFGIFTCNKFTHEGKGLRVEARGNFPLRLNTEKDVVETYRERFAAAWEIISPVDQAADHVLKALAHGLETGDNYYVISDLKSWEKEKQLEQFREASKKAVKERGVSLKRIINLAKENLDDPSAAAEAVRVLEELRRESSECSSKYEVKVLLKEDMEKPELKNQLQNEQLKKMQIDHFGIFTCGKFQHDSKGLRVEPGDNFPVRLTTDKREVADCRERFAAAWDAISAPDDGMIEKLKRRFPTPPTPTSGERAAAASPNAALPSRQIH